MRIFWLLVGPIKWVKHLTPLMTVVYFSFALFVSFTVREPMGHVWHAFAVKITSFFFVGWHDKGLPLLSKWWYHLKFTTFIFIYCFRFAFPSSAVRVCRQFQIKKKTTYITFCSQFAYLPLRGRSPLTVCLIRPQWLIHSYVLDLAVQRSD